MITLCTLFNTNYIDKGLTMYESIEKYTQDYVLYVLCMDNRCYEILADMNRPRFVPIRLSDFETEELLRVKKERSMGEYCWTCSSSLVDYIFRTFNPDYCAYIDSDLYFYDDVNIVIKEMEERHASVMITGHRFDKYREKENIWLVGKYCVEFNTFKNDVNGRSLLETWRKQCIEYCKCDGDGVHWGDQKYMDNWCDDYSFCVETSNLGAGIALWNIAQYRLLEQSEYGPNKVKCRGSVVMPFFYHFQQLEYIDDNTVETHTMSKWGVQKLLVDSFYFPYLYHISANKKYLKANYGVNVIIKHHPGVQVKKRSTFEALRSIACKFFTKKGIKYLFYTHIPLKLYGNKGVLKINN